MATRGRPPTPAKEASGQLTNRQKRLSVRRGVRRGSPNHQNLHSVMDVLYALTAIGHNQALVLLMLLSLSTIIYSVVRDGAICMPSDGIIDICDSELLVTFNERKKHRTTQ